MRAPQAVGFVRLTFGFIVVTVRLEWFRQTPVGLRENPPLVVGILLKHLEDTPKQTLRFLIPSLKGRKAFRAVLTLR